MQKNIIWQLNKQSLILWGVFKEKLRIDRFLILKMCILDKWYITEKLTPTAFSFKKWMNFKSFNLIIILFITEKYINVDIASN